MIIYKCQNKINNKIYIGKTVRNLNSRKKQHYRDSKIHDFKFHRALKKYKDSDFEWSEIDTANNEECLSKKEIYWIKYYNSFEAGYNSTLGGEGTSGFTHSDETKKKMMGRVISDENKEKLSKANAIRVISSETKDKMSKSHIGKSEGERNINSKLKEKDVIDIIKLFSEGLTTTEIFKLYNVSIDSIRNIVSGRTWKNVDRSSIENKISHNRSIKLKESDVVEIIHMLSLKKYKYVDIAEIYNVSISTIRDISKNKSWKNIKRL